MLNWLSHTGAPILSIFFFLNKDYFGEDDSQMPSTINENEMERSQELVLEREAGYSVSCSIPVFFLLSVWICCYSHSCILWWVCVRVCAGYVNILPPGHTTLILLYPGKKNVKTSLMHRKKALFYFKWDEIIHVLLFYVSFRCSDTAEVFRELSSSLFFIMLTEEGFGAVGYKPSFWSHRVLCKSLFHPTHQFLSFLSVTHHRKKENLTLNLPACRSAC